jgi:hypothetical protein
LNFAASKTVRNAFLFLKIIKSVVVCYSS